MGGQRLLPEPLGEVQGTDEPSRSQPLDELVHSGHQVGIRVSEIIAEVPASIGLLDQRNGAHQLMWSSRHISFRTWNMKHVLWSVRISLTMPTQLKRRNSSFAMVFPIGVHNGTTSGFRVA